MTINVVVFVIGVPEQLGWYSG